MKVTPYGSSSGTKKEQVTSMFNRIASNYDFLNRFLSLGIDVYWRKKTIALLKPIKPQKILDVATGTADVAIEMSKSLQPEKIIGLDISKQMLEVGQKKVTKANLNKIISLQVGDSEQLPFPDHQFDAITVAFGVRNFENLEKGIQEMYRTLDTKGHLLVLEFSKPTLFPFKQIFNFYFKYILPLIGRLSSKDDRAYQYLYESVQAFPDGEAFLEIMRKCGFKNPQQVPLTFGICSIYKGTK
jgi:demethylmenaquinone methyltransferase/2-methoxy-6-polyprenyl-1,4-benzoquinol methylase